MLIRNHYTSDSSMGNWTYSAVSVGFWNIILTVKLAVPVASYYAALSQEPKFIKDNTWQWSYDFDYFTSTFHSRLTAEVNKENVSWKMYISKTGIGGFDEVLWYHGTSNIDGTGGTWHLNYRNDNTKEVIPYLQADWSWNNGKMVKSKYTYIEEGKTGQGGYIEYGVQDGSYDRYYNMHFVPLGTQSFVDVYINWNNTTKEGQVKSEPHFNDTQWHCWDATGYDAVCE